MTRSQANLLLIVAAALWGFGNVAQKTVLEHLDPFSAVGLRCLIGGMLILPLLRLDRSGALAPGYWPSAVRVAAIFALALLAQQAAYLSTTVTNAGFLVNTAAVMTPILAWLVFRERASLRVWGAAGVTLIGVFMLCGGMQGMNALAIETDDPNLSDWYQNNLIVGPDAFVMQVGGFDSFGDAILEKLAREIAPPVLAAIQPPALPDIARN